MEIAKATIDAVDAVTDLWVALAVDQRRHGSHLRTDANRHAIRETIARRAVVDELFIARTDADEIVGFAMGSIELATYDQDVVRGVVENLYVDPSYRGEGVGSDLLEAVEASLADEGADVLSLEAMADNRGARRFYERNGYELHRIELEKSVSPPALDSSADSAVDSPADSAVDSPADPAVDPDADPAVDPAADPGADAVADSAGDHVDESVTESDGEPGGKHDGEPDEDSSDGTKG